MQILHHVRLTLRVLSISKLPSEQRKVLRLKRRVARRNGKWTPLIRPFNTWCRKRQRIRCREAGLQPWRRHHSSAHLRNVDVGYLAVFAFGFALQRWDNLRLLRLIALLLRHGMLPLDVLLANLVLGTIHLLNNRNKLALIMCEAAPRAALALARRKEAALLGLVEWKCGPELVRAVCEGTSRAPRASPSRSVLLAELGAGKVWAHAHLGSFMCIRTRVTPIAHAQDVELAHGGLAELSVHLLLEVLDILVIDGIFATIR